MLVTSSPFAIGVLIVMGVLMVLFGYPSAMVIIIALAVPIVFTGLLRRASDEAHPRQVIVSAEFSAN